MTGPTRGVLRRKDQAAPPLSFHYNPTSVVVTKQTGWRGGNQRNAAGAPHQEYVGGKAATMTLTLLFDATDDSGRSVTEAVRTLTEWACPTAESLRNHRPQPPVLVLQWGTESYFPCRLKQLRTTYTLFSPAGTPVRATVAVSLVEVPDEPAAQNPTSGGPSGRRSVLVGAGDTLPSLAYREFGDPNLWRALAELNGVDDPLRLRPGTALLVPSRSDAAILAARPGPSPAAAGGPPAALPAATGTPRAAAAGRGAGRG